MNTTNNNLLDSSFHKLYSALQSLEQFNICNDLIDNISNLDKFFLEFRNITFALQKALTHTEYLKTYESLRDKHLKNSNSQWLIDIRNKVSKQQPFELKKQITITIYEPIADSPTLKIQLEEFNIEDEKDYSSQIENIKFFIKSLNILELHFSIEFLYYENPSVNLFENITVNIQNMLYLLTELEQVIYGSVITSNKFKDKIRELNFYRTPKDILFNQDYVYYADLDEFDVSQTMFMAFSEGKDLSLPTFLKDLRLPLNNIGKFISKNEISCVMDAFLAFYLMHVIAFSEQKELMPAFMVIFEDNSYFIHPFSGSNRTTFYREIQNIVDLISNENVKAVFYTGEVYFYPKEAMTTIYSKSYKNRIEQHNPKEMLQFYLIGQGEEIISVSLDSDRVDDNQYVMNELKNMRLFNYNEGINSFSPIAHALNSKI